MPLLPQTARHGIGKLGDIPWHIDTTVVPIGPETVLVADRKMPDDETVKMLKAAGYRIFVCAEGEDGGFWHMNCLSIGHGRVFVDDSDEQFLEQLRSLGCKPIPTSMRCCRMAYYGMFHCTTLDLKRRSGL